MRGRLREAVLRLLDDAGLTDLTRVVLDTADVRACAIAFTPLVTEISTVRIMGARGRPPITGSRVPSAGSRPMTVYSPPSRSVKA